MSHGGFSSKFRRLARRRGVNIERERSKSISEQRRRGRGRGPRAPTADEIKREQVRVNKAESKAVFDKLPASVKARTQAAFDKSSGSGEAADLGQLKATITRETTKVARIEKRRALITAITKRRKEQADKALQSREIVQSREAADRRPDRTPAEQRTFRERARTRLAVAARAARGPLLPSVGAVQGGTQTQQFTSAERPEVLAELAARRSRAERLPPEQAISAERPTVLARRS